jgi:UDP-glucose 4-epimerase
MSPVRNTSTDRFTLMRVLVTGGAGYLGSHLVDLLCDEGHDVRVLDDLSTGRLDNLRDRLDCLEFTRGSILDADIVDREVANSELVFHLAAAVGVSKIVRDPLTSIMTNTRGTEHVFEACARRGAKVVLASTSEVYGKTAKVPMHEDDDRVLGPTNVRRWSYSTAKAVDEHLAFAYAEEGLKFAIVRYFNSYGPRIDEQGYGSVVANFIRQAFAGGPLTVHGDGLQTRCFTYADDTVRGTYLAGFVPAAEGTVINLGTTRETSIRELAELVREVSGRDVEIETVRYEAYYGPGFEDTRRRVPDNRRAKEVLGWTPTVELEDGLGRVVKWWCEVHG